MDEVLNMMIFGIHGKAPSLSEIFTHNAVSWLGTKVRLLHFEELLRHVKNIETAEAEAFFASLLKDCGMGELPEDWRERVRVGSDRKQSGTARENLVGGGKIEVPDELPDMQKKLVNYAAPGLREILGYEIKSRVLPAGNRHYCKLRIGPAAREEQSHPMIVTESFVFIHMHKTGGQTLNDIIRRCMPDHRVIGYHYPRSEIPPELRHCP